jgi:Zn-finger nucleic acid-binding protein
MGKPVCPRCDEPLAAQRYHDVPVEVCPDCTGMWVAQRALRALTEAIARDVLGEVDVDTALDPLPDAGGGLACPACAGPLEHFGYMGANVVELDRCEGCGAVWLDADELYWVATLYARTAARKAGVVKVYEQVRREALELQEARTRAEALVRRTLVRRMLS